MKVVYIAGPYGDAGGFVRARELAATLAINDIGFCCPHLNSAHFEVITPEVPVSFWRELDLKLLQACDGVAVLAGWQRSEGTKAEIAEAEKLGLRVFYLTDLEELEENNGWDSLLEWSRQ